MRARSSDYVGYRVKSKVSRWLFFYSNRRGWIRWLGMDNLEERVEARVDKSRDESWTWKNVQCVLYLFIIIDRTNDFSQFFNFDICENTNV